MYAGSGSGCRSCQAPWAPSSGYGGAGLGPGFLPCWPSSTFITGQGSWTAGPWAPPSPYPFWGPVPVGPSPYTPYAPPGPGPDPPGPPQPFNPLTGCRGIFAKSVCAKDVQGYPAGKTLFLKGIHGTAEPSACDDETLYTLHETLTADGMCASPQEAEDAITYLKTLCTACDGRVPKPGPGPGPGPGPHHPHPHPGPPPGPHHPPHHPHPRPGPPSGPPHVFVAARDCKGIFAQASCASGMLYLNPSGEGIATGPTFQNSLQELRTMLKTDNMCANDAVADSAVAYLQSLCSSSTKKPSPHAFDADIDCKGMLAGTHCFNGMVTIGSTKTSFPCKGTAFTENLRKLKTTLTTDDTCGSSPAEIQANVTGALQYIRDACQNCRW